MRVTRRELNGAFLGWPLGSVLSARKTRAAQSAVWPTVQGNAARTGYCHSEEAADIEGGVVWKAKVSNEIKTPAVVSNGVVVVATTDGRVAAFDLKNGEKRWERNGTSRIERAPTVDHNTVYVYLEEGWMHGLDLRTGETRWRTDLGNDLLGVSRSVVVDGILYISAGVTYAMDTSSGEIRWQVDPETGDPRRGFAVHDGRIFMGGTAYAEALDAEDGQQVWTADIGTRVWGLATSSDDVYISIGPPNEVKAFSTETGDRQWTFSITEEERNILVASPIVMDETIVAADWDCNVAAASKADGSVQWRYSVDGKLLHHPVACGDRVYLPTDQEVVALSMSSGEVQWRTQVGKTPRSPALAGDRLLVTTQDGTLHAIGSESGLLDRWETELGVGTAGLLGLGGYGAYRYLRSQQPTESS